MRWLNPAVGLMGMIVLTEGEPAAFSTFADIPAVVKQVYLDMFTQILKLTSLLQPMVNPV